MGRFVTQKIGWFYYVIDILRDDERVTNGPFRSKREAEACAEMKNGKAKETYQ